MDNNLEGKLKRALQHSSDFLFGLPVEYNNYETGRQLRIYKWLREEGKKKWGETFDFQIKPYDEVTSQLLVNPGIEKLVKDIIIPRVDALFTDTLQKELQAYWLNGQKPDNMFLTRYCLNKETAFPFLIVTEYKTNPNIKNIDGWGELFALTWFEFIEPWIEERKTQKSGNTTA